MCESINCKTNSEKNFTIQEMCKENIQLDQIQKKLTTVIQTFVLELVFKTPGIYLDEIQRRVCEEFCVNIDISNICRFLEEAGLSVSSKNAN